MSETSTKSIQNYSSENLHIKYRSNSDNHETRGILCYVENNYNVQIINSFIHYEEKYKNVHHVELILLKYEEIYILTEYKSPLTNNSIFNYFLLKCSTQLLSNSDFILIGDFNHNTYDESSSFEK